MTTDHPIHIHHHPQELPPSFNSQITLCRVPAQVISTSGDTHLGGEDFDHRVMDYFVKLIKKKYKADVSTDARALQKLRREAERAKRALSSSPQVILTSEI